MLRSQWQQQELLLDKIGQINQRMKELEEMGIHLTAKLIPLVLVVHLFEISDHPRPGRVPSQPFLGECAGSRHIKTSKRREKAEVRACLFRGQ